jgi:hypothetical protein
MADPIIPFIYMLQYIQEVLAILIVLKDRLLSVATRGDMIDCSGIFNTKWSSHEPTLT